VAEAETFLWGVDASRDPSILIAMDLMTRVDGRYAEDARGEIYSNKACVLAFPGLPNYTYVCLDL